jgi:hypothetical protein
MIKLLKHFFLPKLALCKQLIFLRYGTVAGGILKIKENLMLIKNLMFCLLIWYAVDKEYIKFRELLKILKIIKK